VGSSTCGVEGKEDADEAARTSLVRENVEVEVLFDRVPNEYRVPDRVPTWSAIASLKGHTKIIFTHSLDASSLAHKQYLRFSLSYFVS